MFSRVVAESAVLRRVGTDLLVSGSPEGMGLVTTAGNCGSVLTVFAVSVLSPYLGQAAVCSSLDPRYSLSSVTRIIIFFSLLGQALTSCRDGGGKMPGIKASRVVHVFKERKATLQLLSIS